MRSTNPRRAPTVFPPSRPSMIRGNRFQDGRHNRPRCATHFLMKRLPKVAIEMALHVLAYNLTRVINMLGVKPLIAAMGT